jgi:hypothetical protein
MGVFDFLFGKRNAIEPGPDPAAVWAGLGEQERARWFGEQLRVVEAACEKAGIRVSAELGQAELRGNYADRPIAIEIDKGGRAELSVKFINRRGHLNLGPPIPGISDRPPADGFWSEDADVQAPVVAPGVAINATGKTIVEAQAVWAALPGALRERLATWIAASPYSYVVARHQAIDAMVLVGPQYRIDVAPAILQSLELLVAVAQVFGEGEAVILPLGAGPSWMPDRSTCRYCSTSYFVEVGDTRCPACGAPGGAASPS